MRFVAGIHIATDISLILTIAVVVMLLALSTYCLPSLLGYLLFVGISGRFDPVSRPTHLQERPCWALGVWVGTTVALTLTAFLHLANQTNYRRIDALVEPGIWLLAVLLLPGLIAAIAYRNTINRILTEDARVFREGSLSLAEVIDFPLQGTQSTGAVLDFPARGDFQNTSVEDATTDTPVVTTFLANARPGLVAIPDIPAAGIAGSEVTLAMHHSQTDDSDLAQSPLQLALDDERSQHKETEKHLRITRRALYQLDAESRDSRDVNADAMIVLERELGERIRETAAAEESAVHEATLRTETEQQILDLKEEVLTSRRDARRSNAAREKALAAAGRSVALARQAVESREEVELQLSEAEQILENRQETITSLITALEVEKSRSGEEVASLARQWVLQERQLHARRSLEEVARSVEGRLTTRMARKVARARPIVSSS